MKQFAVIGISTFGYHLAIQLYKKGHEVLAIDKDSQRVQDIKDLVTRAVVADGTDSKAMGSMGLDKMDATIICTSKNLGESVLIALTIKDIGGERVQAIAGSHAHQRILYKLGISEVLFPEKDSALSLAERLHNPNMIDYLPFVEGYSIIQLSPPDEFVGKTLRDLNLINRFGVQVVAIKELIPDRLSLIPTAQFILKSSDILILLGPNDALEKLSEGSE